MFVCLIKARIIRTMGRTFFSAFLLLTVSSYDIFSKNNLHFFKCYEKIEVVPEQNKFISYTRCTGNSMKEASPVYVHYAEMQFVTDLKASYLDPTGKSVEMNPKSFTLNDISSENFYENIHEYKINFPVTNFFEYSFTQVTVELMKLSLLDLNKMFICDTEEYEIVLPKGYTLLYKICNVDSNSTVRIDSAVETNVTRYHFISFNKISDKTTDEMTKSYYMPFALKTLPAIKILVIPDTKKSNPEKYFNDWYLKIISSLPEISRRNYKEITSQVTNEKDTDAFIGDVFRFVQKKIKYLSIENGLEAFTPRDPNSILQNKQGDCKDMALLLHSALEHYGVKSYLALAATLDYPFDTDFPSLSSGDHMICAVHRNNRWMFLDATEFFCEYGMPSTAIQQKHVFIMSKDTCAYLPVPAVDASLNQCNFDVSFRVGKELSDGKFKYDFRHLSANFYKYIRQNSTDEQFTIAMNSMFKDLTNGCSHESLTVNASDTMMQFSGILKAGTAGLNSYGNQTYLPVDFMPYLDWLPKNFKMSNALIVNSSLNKKGHLTLSFDNAVHLKNARKKSFNENGFQFEITFAQPDDHTISVDSDLLFNDVVIRQEQLPAFRKMILFITGELNKGIIYE
jgi:hypothetical protein